ncbi:MAG: molecular chaperone DnaJ [Chthoniobacteraceae bacterium]|nr:molecular chaperone DnaJ [Chthoniobacteraceae bacterium]
MNPFLILRLSPDATDADIRRAYLDGIRQCPPERDAERFQAISQAYEQIRDESKRLQYRLFDMTSPGMTLGEVVQKYCVAVSPPKPLEFELMKTFLRSCLTK